MPRLPVVSNDIKEPSGWVRVSHELFEQMCDQLGCDVEFHSDHTATVTKRNA